jgi:NADH-quinone oxidoreductase subunit K
MILLFTVGLVGLFVNRKNLIVSAMCIELIFLAINYEFLLHSTAFAEIHGQVMSILILTVTAAETACALALLVAYFLSEFELAVSYQRIVKHKS